MKKNKIILCILIASILLIFGLGALRFSYLNNPRTRFNEYAATLNFEKDFEVKESQINTYWFGDKTGYFLLKYKQESMSIQLNKLQKDYRFIKSNNHSETSFDGLINGDFNDVDLYKKISLFEYDTFYYLDDFNNEAHFYIFVINENSIAVFFSIG